MINRSQPSLVAMINNTKYGSYSTNIKIQWWDWLMTNIVILCITNWARNGQGIYQCIKAWIFSCYKSSFSVFKIRNESENIRIVFRTATHPPKQPFFQYKISDWLVIFETGYYMLYNPWEHAVNKSWAEPNIYLNNFRLV